MMLQEASIFGRHHGVLQIRRDLTERNEFVMLLVGAMLPHRFHSALYLDGGRGRVDPTQREYEQDTHRVE